MSGPNHLNPDRMDLDHDASATDTADPGSHELSSSPLSSLPSVTPSAPSSGTPTPQKKNNTSPTAGSVNNASKPTAAKQAGGYAEKAPRPTESDYLALEYDLLDPKNLHIASTAMHDFLSAMEEAVALPPPKYYNPRQNLQAFLIQQQLLAGIPVDKLEPMQGVESRQRVMGTEGILRRFNAPSFMTITQNGTFLPQIPPATFTGNLKPLPIKAALPKPNWVKRAAGDFCHQVNTNGTNSINPLTTAGPLPSENNTDSKPADDKMDFSAYFSSAEEQEQITQFFAAHFSTGSGILVDQSAEADDTESDYPTDFWSDHDDDTESEY